MVEYVVGLGFNSTKDQVLLVRKTKPSWQAGKLNGVGGKVEPDEQAIDAMFREFYEETGKDISGFPSAVRKTLILHHNGNIVHFYKLEFEDLTLVSMNGEKTDTDEVLEVVGVEDLYKETVMSNLKWIIPLSLDDDVLGPVFVNDMTKPGEGQSKAE